MQSIKIVDYFESIGDIYKKSYSLLLANVLAYPIARMQSILQIQQSYKIIKNKYTTKSLFKEINSKQGIFAHYRGMSSLLYRGFFSVTLLQLFSHTISKLINPEQLQKHSHHFYFLSYFLVNMISYPLQISMLRFQLDLRQKYDEPLYKKIRSSIKMIYKLEGLKSIYRGMGLSLFQNLSIIGLSEYIYDSLQSTISEKYIRAISSYLISEFLLYPLDSIKKKIQINGAINHKKLFTSTRDCWQQIFRTEGIRGFYRGLHLRCLYVPVYGIVYLQNSTEFQSNRI